MKNGFGFTLIELLITFSVLLFVVSAVYVGFNFSQKAYRSSESGAEITQNGRVILERMAREIRQAREIATPLSEEEPGEAVSPAEGIIFEDGHIANPYYYIHYFKENNEVKREVKVFYFSGNPDVYQPWDAVPPQGQTLKEEIIESPRTIGEYVSGLKFWGSRNIKISISLEKMGKSINLKTTIFGRNL